MAGFWVVATRYLGPGAARVDMSSYGGWIVMRPGLTGEFQALVFRFKAASTQAFLSVGLSAGRSDEFPEIVVTGKYLRAVAGGELEAVFPMKELNPEGKPFDRIVIRANQVVDPGFMRIDGVGLWGLGMAAKKDQRAKAAVTPAKKADLAVRVQCVVGIRSTR